MDLAGQQLTQAESDNLSLSLVSRSGGGGTMAHGLLAHGLQCMLVVDCDLRQTFIG